MFFFCKKKTITIDAFVGEDFAHAAETAPITKAYFPDWWKAVPPSTFDYNTMDASVTVRGCVGMINAFQTGFIMPMWSDLAMNLDGIGQWKYQFADRRSDIHHHENDQAPGFFNNHIIFKIRSPWWLQQKGSLKVAYTQPHLWQNSIPFITPGSVNQFSGGIMATHIFAFIEKQLNQQFIIKHGTPMLHIMPLTEDNVTIKPQIITNEELQRKKHNTEVSVNFAYDGLQKRKTCPFRKK